MKRVPNNAFLHTGYKRAVAQRVCVVREERQVALSCERQRGKTAAIVVESRTRQTSIAGLDYEGLLISKFRLSRRESQLLYPVRQCLPILAELVEGDHGPRSTAPPGGDSRVISAMSHANAELQDVLVHNGGKRAGDDAAALQHDCTSAHGERT